MIFNVYHDRQFLGQFRKYTSALKFVIVHSMNNSNDSLKMIIMGYNSLSRTMPKMYYFNGKTLYPPYTYRRADVSDPNLVNLKNAFIFRREPLQPYIYLTTCKNIQRIY
jgi:hypothetical protein